MRDEVLERFARDCIASVTGPEVVFSWQVGEPTLLGPQFSARVVALQRRYAKPGQRIENDLQTNGTVLDEETGHSGRVYLACTSAGGCQVPSPAGRIDGGVSLGQ